MRRRTRNRKRTKRKVKLINPIIVLIVFLIIVFITPRFLSTAKYVYNIIHEHYLSSKDFYFTSDKLSIDHTEYEITNNWSGAETYAITVNMSSKKNDMAYTESDVNYNITYNCSNNISCTLSNQTGTIVGTQNNGVNEDFFTISINPSGGTALSEGEVAWVDITATSTSPYRKSISGKLILEVGTSDIFYEIIDAVNQPYLTVNITNSQSVSSDVTLRYNPSIVLLDMTNRFYLNSANTNSTETLNGYQYLNSVTSRVESLSTTTVKFYKTDPTQDYSYTSGSQATPIITLNN